MERTTFSGMHCSVAQCLEVSGDWWTLLIVRDVFLGARRFDDLQARLGISRNTLNKRLARLVEVDVLKKVPYSERPPRFEYRLTERGRDLWPVIDAMRQWGDKHAAPDGPPVQIVHEGCGHRVDPVLCCPACGDALEARDVRAVAGPGEVERLVLSDDNDSRSS
jgi:DNA-binding HxlR family transcriptional regulator